MRQQFFQQTWAWLNAVPKPQTEHNDDDFEWVDQPDSESINYGVTCLSDVNAGDELISLAKVPSIGQRLRTETSLDYSDELSPSRIASLLHKSNNWSYDPEFDERLMKFLNKPDPTDVPRYEFVEYELAGRDRENTFRDLRSASQARKRQRSDAVKYYGYRGVKSGQLGAPHCREKDLLLALMLGPSPAIEQIEEPVHMDKHMLFREAQCWPKPPTYHHRRKSKDISPWSLQFLRRIREQKHTNQFIAIDGLNAKESIDCERYGLPNRSGCRAVRGDRKKTRQKASKRNMYNV